jgi:hypothetical protein
MGQLASFINCDKNNSTFTNPLLYVFVTNHSILKNINCNGFPKNIIPIALIS